MRPRRWFDDHSTHLLTMPVPRQAANGKPGAEEASKKDSPKIKPKPSASKQMSAAVTVTAGSEGTA